MKSLDYAKGIAILLLIFVHCGAYDLSWVGAVISAFFMPVFFVICGILVAVKHPNGMNLSQFRPYMKRRWNQIFVPYFTFGLMLIAFFQALHILAGQPLTLGAQLFALISMQGIESMWFLPCYVLAEFIYIFGMARLPKRVQVFLATVGVFGVAGIDLWGMPQFWLFRVLMKTWFGMIFIGAGFLLMQYRKKLEKLPKAFWLVMIGVCIMLAVYNGQVGFSALQLGNVFLYFLNGIVLSIALLCVCKIMEAHRYELPLLTMFGQNSIVVVCTNNLFIEIIRLLDYKLTGNFLINAGLAGSILFALLLILIEYMIIRLAQGKLGLLFGKVR